jgi:hypothetical protein
LRRGAPMTVKVNSCRGDGTYYLCDPARELEGLRDGPPGSVLVGPGADANGLVAAIFGRTVADGPPAYDVIVAAPKPVSLLLALEPDEAATRVVALHERAVSSTVSYLTDEAMGSRTSVLVAGFTHGVNRQLDPHLHTHVLVGARGVRGDRVEVGAIRSHAAAADSLYLAELRAGVQAAVGRAAWQSPWGRTMVEGVDYALVAHASAARDRTGRVEREGEKRHPTRVEVREHWQGMLNRHVPVGLDLAPPEVSSAIDEYRFSRALGSGFVRRRDVVRAWADACPTGDDASSVRAAASLAAPLRGRSDRVAAVVVRDAPGVRVLGPRPREPVALEAWFRERAALERYLEAGHRLSHAVDPRGAPASTRLALATLDGARADRARAVSVLERSRSFEGRALS